MVSLHQVAKLWSFGFSNSFLMNVTRLFPLRLTVWISLKSKALSRVFCSTPQFKSNNSPVLSLLYGSTLFLTWIQVYQESGKVVWYSYLSQNFPQFLVTHIVKGFSVVSKAEVDVFLELPCFLRDSTHVGNLISGSSDSLKLILYIWKFSVHILLKLSLKDFQHNLASMWNEGNCTIV